MTELTIITILASAIVIIALGLWLRGPGKKQEFSHRLADDDIRLHNLIEGTIGTTGDTFFYALVRELARYLNLDAVLVACHTDEGSLRYRTQAYWCDESYIMNQSISMADSPCTGGGGFWFLETSAGELFPNSSLLRDRFQVEGFFAIRLQDSSGKAIGMLAGMHRYSLRPGNRQIDIIKLFAARAAAELERSLAVSETLMEKERAQISLHSIGDGVITTDKTGAIDYMNPIAEKLTGWRFHQAMGMSMEVILHLEDEISGRVIPDPARRCLAEKRVIAPKTDNVLISRGGERYSIQGTAAPMLNSQGNCVGVILVFKDVTDSRRQQKMMVHQATHDPLTGLVNRSEFDERVEKAVESGRNFENMHALLFLDLDQFKAVNDSAGHAAGDELLRQVSSLLSSQLRGRDTLGRLGGDEFGVLLENCPVSRASRVADVLIDSIREYRFVWEDKSYQIGVSIGVVAITAEVENRAELMGWADQACYIAKDLGRGRAYVFTDEDRHRGSQQTSAINRGDLMLAIASEQFQLLYQPIWPLDDESTGMHTRAEVLLRMLDADGEYIAAGAFIPAANRFGLMRQIDRWVIKKLFEGYSHVFMQNPDLVLNLNLSAQSVADDSLIDYVTRLFEETVVSPHQICFELSETVLINNFTSAGILIEQLGRLGCSFALDDFGNGLSSFGYLKNVKIDFIKIDGTLTRDICEDVVDRSMVDSINTMAHLMGIKTIAECADSDKVIQQLKELELDYAQGYYLGEPVSMDSFTSLKIAELEDSVVLVN
ncbi:MAG: EAL domain-containing protein [Gammaproteobacteria bacterium]|nr:EAL domain-containing protein [Gammaproteobacteria bacterium]